MRARLVCHESDRLPARERLCVVRHGSGLGGGGGVYQWSFAIDGGVPETRDTPHGEAVFSPPFAGRLEVAVKVLDGSAQEQAALTLTQDVVATNATLETMIADARNALGPTVDNPEVARELINEHNLYYQSVAPETPEAGDGFKTFVFMIALDGALAQTPSARRERLDRLAAALNDKGGDFAGVASGPFGVCGLRLAVLAMTAAAPALPWTEFPDTAPQRAAGEAGLLQALAALSTEARTDLFNLARFPKSNIRQCGRAIETLRNRYFSGASFDDVLTRMSGVAAHWIVRNYREGPLLRT